MPPVPLRICIVFLDALNLIWDTQTLVGPWRHNVAIALKSNPCTIIWSLDVMKYQSSLTGSNISLLSAKMLVLYMDYLSKVILAVCAYFFLNYGDLCA